MALTLDQLTYENFLKASNQEAPLDLGDWEEYTSDYDLGIDAADYEDDDIDLLEEGEEPMSGEEKYLEARTEAYAKYIEDRFDDWLYKYKRFTWPLTLYRAVCLDSIEDLDEEALGLDWSDEKTSAQCYHSKPDRGDTYTIIAQVGKNDIDWEKTIFRNLNPSFGDDEQEVNILPNISVNVVDIEGPDGLTGKQFTGNSGDHHHRMNVLSALKELIQTA